ncbi:MAG: transcription antiterminator BglG, partial [Clostridiales bacterium]|nr:transcription antiterminator BglG [Clostridiales bacterium]
MEVKQIINNNVISALDPSGREVVIMGKGIGFHGKHGSIEKT